MKSDIYSEHFQMLPNNLRSHVSLTRLPHDKILDLLKLKTFPYVKFIFHQNMISVVRMRENIVGNGENAGYQHFLHFPQCFQKFYL